MIEKVSILEIPVHNVTMEETVSQIETFIHSGKSHFVITLGTEMVMRAHKNPELQNLIQKASLVIPDGGGLVWASRRLKQPLKEKVAGIELVERICSLSGEKNWKIFFLGGKPGTAEKATQNLMCRFPSIQIAGTHPGYFQDEEIFPILKKIKPHILLAGLGFPKQEFWLSRNLEKLEIPVGIGVGGSLDVLANELKRAPKWMIQLNLEWLFRLLQEPNRLKRMADFPKFMFLVLRKR